MWPAFSESALRPVQAAILRLADPAAGLTIIEAPMGEGKPEAGAFQAARGLSLIHICGLPERPDLRLCHRRIPRG